MSSHVKPLIRSDSGVDTPHLTRRIMAISVSSTGSVVSTVTRTADNSGQIASLQKTLQDLEKQLTQASASGSSSTSTQLVQLLSQEISLVESQISQLQQPSTPTAPAPAQQPKVQQPQGQTSQTRSGAKTESDKPSAAQLRTAEAAREKRAKATALEAQSSIGTQVDVYA